MKENKKKIPPGLGMYIVICSVFLGLIGISLYESLFENRKKQVCFFDVYHKKKLIAERQLRVQYTHCRSFIEGSYQFKVIP